MLNKTVKEKRFHVNLVQTFKKKKKRPINQSCVYAFRKHKTPMAIFCILEMNKSKLTKSHF